ncbi:MAG: ATP-binding protein, partial [Coprothermobacterota bacterium]|nr:ATP-binding protein [Coprothermobacterota bacterium]
DLVIPLYSVGPLLNATGQDPLAVLVIRIDPDKFLYPLIQSWPTPSPSGETLLVRKEGEAVVYLNELRHRQGTALVLRIPIGDGTLLAAKAVLGQTGFFEGIDYRGIPALGVVRPIPDSTWFIVAKVDRAEIFAPLSQSGWLLFGLVAALILAAGGAIGFFWRRQQIQVYRRQVQIGQERLAAQRLFNQFFNMSLDPLCIAGLDGYFKQLNPAFASTLGFSRDELLSKPFLEFVHPEDRPAMLAATEQLSTGQALTRFANRYACKDGSYRWLSWTIHPDPQEQLLYAVAHDITENRQAEEVIRKLNAELEQRVRERTAELEDAVKELETFSYSVSHDLRSPLRAIDGFSRLLLTTTAGHLDGEQERLLQVIRSSTQQMGQLIADLLAFARLGRQELRKSKVDMEKLAHSVFAELRTANSGRPLELVMDSIPPALGDPSMLRQVWFNLLSNAVKFTRGRDPARIEIGSQTEDGMNRYSVKDNGVGFDMHYADKLFGVFQRLHSTREFEGTGVGLAIVQRVIHRLGGKVQADGTVGAGATFAFTLPKGE